LDIERRADPQRHVHEDRAIQRNVDELIIDHDGVFK
jgi:hypothetical protein